MIKRIDPPLWLRTPRGDALAYFLIDYGIDHDLQWVCFQHDTGECWTYDNSEIRLIENQTMRRSYVNIPSPSDVAQRFANKSGRCGND